MFPWNCLEEISSLLIKKAIELKMAAGTIKNAIHVLNFRNAAWWNTKSIMQPRISHQNLFSSAVIDKNNYKVFPFSQNTIIVYSFSIVFFLGLCLQLVFFRQQWISSAFCYKNSDTKSRLGLYMDNCFWNTWFMKYALFYFCSLLCSACE